MKKLKQNAPPTEAPVEQAPTVAELLGTDDAAHQAALIQQLVQMSNGPATGLTIIRKYNGTIQLHPLSPITFDELHEMLGLATRELARMEAQQSPK